MMELEGARRMATALMAEHGLVGWRLVLDNAKTRAGVCRPARREIGLSRGITALHTEAEVRDTVLHEIAHALVGAHHGHDAVWRAKALEIGSSGRRCVDTASARPPAPWTGTCPAGHTTTRHRRPTRVVTCGQCSRSFDPRHVITWRFRGEVVPMHPAYDRELARLRRRTAAAPVAARGDRPEPTVAAELVALPVGTVVRVGGSGRYAGTTGVVEKRARTRYHVRTRLGLLTVPFAMAEPV
jgi:predicted SprT family Zn-dependent metalloprotease